MSAGVRSRWAELERALSARHLARAGTYDRVVCASLARVWENVFDWEHLPWLHAQSFRSVALLDTGPWGWKIEAVLASGPATIELRAERENLRYVSATLAGPGAGTEIWTRLAPVDSETTEVHVEFWVPTRESTDEARLERWGQSLRRTYVELWDQDEAMMQARTRALESRARPMARPGEDPSESDWVRNLGALEDLSPQLPFEFDLAGDPHRLLEREGVLFAHSLRCPHKLGPLAADPACPGVVRCPWHGYTFDAYSGASLDGYAVGLWHAHVEVDSETRQVWVRRSRRYRRTSRS